MVWHVDFRDVSLAFVWTVEKLGKIMLLMMPIMASTMTISINVNPFFDLISIGIGFYIIWTMASIKL